MRVSTGDADADAELTDASGAVASDGRRSCRRERRVGVWGMPRGRGSAADGLDVDVKEMPGVGMLIERLRPEIGGVAICGWDVCGMSSMSMGQR